MAAASTAAWLTFSAPSPAPTSAGSRYGSPYTATGPCASASSTGSPHRSGSVSVGTDHDTAAFAVETIRRWWQATGPTCYPQASRLLITADGGGSNGYRTRLWKTELAVLATDTGLQISVCHLPPGTSKWNKIEHRLFSHISMNWRGRPLTSHDVIVQSIAATTTRTGLSVHAELDTTTYPTGVKIPNAQMKALDDTGTLRRHDWHPEWNYTLNPSHE